MSELTKPVIFFDGLCGTCNLYVDIILRLDKKEKLLFAPIQGETAQMLIAEDLRNSLLTIVFRTPDGQIYIKSMAVWMTFALLSWPWKVVSFARFIPLSISDFFYVIVARYRYLLGGRRAECRLPDENERARFLK